MRKVKIKVTGLVQNVGFRFLTMMKANELNINGTVENCEDGSVYIEAGGENKDMERFIKALEKSLGPASKVEKVEVEDDGNLKIPNKFIIK